MKRTKYMKRVMVALLMGLVVAVALSGCGRLVPEPVETLSVYATFYPIYALTDAVMEGIPDAELHCLVQPQDGCLRAYQLSDWDVSLLSAGADAVIAGGRGLESFESALFGWGDEGPAISAVLYNLELYQGREGEGDSETESHLAGPNPHLYMSIPGAGQIVESVSAMLMSLDPRYAETYVANAEVAEERLDELFAVTREELSRYKGSLVVLMNEALVYIARDYGLEVAEWIERESGESMEDRDLEACLERLEEAGAKIILIEKQAPQALVEALQDAGYAVARLDVMSTHREGEGFERYLEIQSDNARVLREAFECAEAGKD